MTGRANSLFKFQPTLSRVVKCKQSNAKCILDFPLFLAYLRYRIQILRCKIIQTIDRAQTLWFNVFRSTLKMFDSYLGAEGYLPQPDDIPKDCTGPVWILGCCYQDPAADLEAIRNDVTSKLWFTYRRSFVPVGSPQLTTDKGWGCMLRCGQMILAQTLVQLHLGRSWRWSSETRSVESLS